MLQPLPAGVVPDAAADFSYFALQSNANAYCGQLTSAATAGTNYAVATTVLPAVLRLTYGSIRRLHDHVADHGADHLGAGTDHPDQWHLRAALRRAERWHGPDRDADGG